MLVERTFKDTLGRGAIAQCVWFDVHGTCHQHSFYLDHLEYVAPQGSPAHACTPSPEGEEPQTLAPGSVA